MELVRIRLWGSREIETTNSMTVAWWFGAAHYCCTSVLLNSERLFHYDRVVQPLGTRATM